MRRGQISLELMFLLMIFMLILVYSINNVSFSKGPSVEVLKAQIALESKSLANAISNTISQVYAQGPGSKATTYVKLTYLKDSGYLRKAFSGDSIFITYINGTCVGVPTGNELYSSGDNKNFFCTRSLYLRDLSNTPTFPSTLNLDGKSVNGMVIKAENLHGTLKVVVEWIPGDGNTWQYDDGVLRINIDPGG
ncbi:class III signal peptide-containing protein [Pyrococcus kukulkanii]|uniref:class III signal peptide-containing protein n=1 Tax=Pyrococcus kukulkanii TaxID=1609559 RepID=UPI003561D350